MKIFRFICDTIDVDCVLSYNQLQRCRTPASPTRSFYLKQKGIGVMNAGPFSARLLTNAPLPHWLKEPEDVKLPPSRLQLCASSTESTSPSWQCSLVRASDIATTIAGSANPANIRKWADWLSQPIDRALLNDCRRSSPR